MLTTFLSLIFAIPLAVAAPQVVTVGQGGLVYTPSSLTVVPGDQVTFEFRGSHTVTQSSFDAPCTPLVNAAGAEVGVDSGYVTVASGVTTFPLWTLNVTDASPAWFYCRLGPHCNLGMVFALNPPATGNTFDAFLAAAKNATVVEPTGSSALSGSGIVATVGVVTPPTGASSLTSAASGNAQTSTSAPSSSNTASGSSPSSTSAGGSGSGGTGGASSTYTISTICVGIVALAFMVAA